MPSQYMLPVLNTPRQNRVLGHSTFPQICQWKSVSETQANQDMWFWKYVSILVQELFEYFVFQIWELNMIQDLGKLFRNSKNKTNSIVCFGFKCSFQLKKAIYHQEYNHTLWGLFNASFIHNMGHIWFKRCFHILKKTLEHGDQLTLSLIWSKNHYLW